MLACTQPGCSHPDCSLRDGVPAFLAAAGSVKNRNASKWVQRNGIDSTTASVASVRAAAARVRAARSAPGTPSPTRASRSSSSRGSGCRGAQQIRDEFDRAGAGPQMLGGHRHTVCDADRIQRGQGTPAPPRCRPAQHDAEAGMPDPQLARPQAVVAEQEVPDRMRLADLRAPACGPRNSSTRRRCLRSPGRSSRPRRSIESAVTCVRCASRPRGPRRDPPAPPSRSRCRRSR